MLLVKSNAFNLSSASKMSIIISQWDEIYSNTVVQSQFPEGVSIYQIGNNKKAKQNKTKLGYIQYHRTQITRLPEGMLFMDTQAGKTP